MNAECTVHELARFVMAPDYAAFVGHPNRKSYNNLQENDSQAPNIKRPRPQPFRNVHGILLLISLEAYSQHALLFKLNMIKYFRRQILWRRHINFLVELIKIKTCSKIYYFYRRYYSFLIIDLNENILRFQIAMDHSCFDKERESLKYLLDY